MQVQKHIEVVKVTIVMTEAEAVWLKAILQNPLNGVAYEDEDKRDQGIRKSFWDALHREGIG